jgi:hypothetical protein
MPVNCALFSRPYPALTFASITAPFAFPLSTPIDTYIMPSAQPHVKLQDATLWVDQALIDGKLVDAKSGKRFNVEGEHSRDKEMGGFHH